jgi:tetratricopeptide (TPR) repeat protein
MTQDPVGHVPGDDTSARAADAAAQQVGWRTVADLLAARIAGPGAPRPAAEYLRLGEALSHLGQFNEAFENFTQAARHWPADAAVWRGLAYSAGKCGNPAAAAEAWKAALDLSDDPSHQMWWWSAYLEALTRLQRLDDARDAAAELRRRWPEEPAGWRGGAFIATRMARWSDAAELWSGCIARTARARQQLSYWSNLANALLQTGRTAEAEEAFNEILTRWPDDPAGWRGVIRILASRSGWPRAGRMVLRRSTPAQLHPEAVETEIISTFLRAGRHAEAATRIARLREANPNGTLWIRSRLELLAVVGDDRQAYVELVSNARMIRGAGLFSAAFMAMTARNAGIAPCEARAMLEACFGKDAADEALTQAYALAGTQPGAALPAWRVDPVCEMGEAWLGEARARLRSFLRDRSYARFREFAAYAIRHATPTQLSRLAALAARRFPHSRLTAQLQQMMADDGGCFPSEALAFASCWRTTLPLRDALSVAPQLSGRAWRKLVCAVVIRDEHELLMPFLAHYRKLGVESFIIIDNGSREALPPEVTYASADIMVLQNSSRFADARHGMTWINEILEAGCCDWLLFADCDEFLIYPGCEALSLPELVSHLDSRGETAMMAPMLDVCDRGFLAGAAISDNMSEHRVIDASWVSERNLLAPWRRFQGGIRAGLVDSLTKTPLVKASAGVRYANNHCVTACRVARTRGALIHRKIFRDRTLMTLPAADVSTHSRVRDRSTFCISRHVALADNGGCRMPDSPFRMALSESGLMRIGYIATDEAWAALMSTPRPPDFVGAAEATRRAIAARAGLTLAEPLLEARFATMLAELPALARSAGRHELRRVLHGCMARIEAVDARRAMIIVVAAGLGQDALVERRLARLRAQMARGGDRPCLNALKIAAAALQDWPDTACALLEMARALGGLDPGETERLATIHIRMGRHAEAAVLLEDQDFRSSDQAFYGYLDSLRGLRDWPRYYETLEAALRGAQFRPKRDVLRRISVCPSSEMQRHFLEALGRPLAARSEALRGEEAVVYLAVLCRLDRTAECGEAYDHLAGALPEPARIFFGRLTGRSQTRHPSGPVWGLGLSKTGTTSLHDFLTRHGLICAHFLNGFLGTIIDARDASLFDAISDSSAVHIARSGGLPHGSRAIATVRSFESWAPSFMLHFQRQFHSPGADFDRLRRIVEKEDLAFGEVWKTIHRDLYFQFRDLDSAFENHREWLSRLPQGNINTLSVTMDQDDAEKARHIARFLDLRGPSGDFARRNRALPPTR